MSFFGTNIKKIRQVKGLSQKAFADLLDLNRGVISSYEEERAEPKIETILKVASHFSLDLDKLLTETLETDQLLNVSGMDQLSLFPETTINERNEESSLQDNNSKNHSVLQKILASVDLIYEFTTENPLLPQYNYGDILFLNKADLKIDPTYNLLVYTDGNLQYASRTDKQNLYKIVGQVSISEKNIFTDIFKRLEKLERKE
ncbi:XRE family transcriptional regulator [Chryseobacterium joostei]|uniref:DNA-binding transcriptional regulator, XRE-family HTH domain n=1 Tax=Chryseobacterium joostei TaxID=112234 RepID=A0A1N7I750_9FLAO|nr:MULTISPECIES: helix-turn-helix transcriptional regulator [Chryseobacterium]AZB00729.1 XRE family transcriptional regulator [Chryseobacterium joostei]SIS32889.1 DNA-binding transcriptional regulator, XRE-family HTH domain [Chryseobacterium joostei]HCM34853.1 XRE family transcriptional regulator [Chryseobacterium sp.]